MDKHTTAEERPSVYVNNSAVTILNLYSRLIQYLFPICRKTEQGHKRPYDTWPK